jgi:hypothetical protein
MGNYEYTSFYDYEDQSNRVWHRDSTQISFRSATYVQVPLGISFAILPSMDLGIELLGQLPVLTRATRRNYVFINDPGIPTSHNLANDPGTPVENRRLILPNIRSGINLQKHWRRASLGFGYRMDLISSISQIKFPESQANAVSSNNFRPLSNYYISFRFSL